MKKIIFLSIFLLISISLVFLIKMNTNRKMKLETQFSTFSFNDFNFLNENKFQFEENIAILFFNTTCAICELEAEQLMDKKSDFVDLIFVSPEHKDTILNFANKFRLYHKPGFYFAQMDTLLIKDKYKPRGLPAYILYQNDLLIESGKGLISTDQLQQAFKLNIE